MPSMGQMMPHSMTMGRKLPIAMYVAVRSFSQAEDTTKPAEERPKIQIFLLAMLQSEYLTETHSTQSSQDSEQNDPADVAVQCQSEY